MLMLLLASSSCGTRTDFSPSQSSVTPGKLHDFSEPYLWKEENSPFLKTLLYIIHVIYLRQCLHHSKNSVKSTDIDGTKYWVSTGSKMHCTTRGIEPIFLNICKWEVTFQNCIKNNFKKFLKEEEWTVIHTDFPDGSVLKNLPANAREARDASSIPGLGRSPGEGNSNPLGHSCLENPMGRGTQAWLSDWTTTIHAQHRMNHIDIMLTERSQKQREHTV